MIHVIAACGENRVIGKDGRMPWNIPEDLKHFKELTMGHTVIMGRKTYESIGKALPGRRNIVVSRTLQQLEGCEVTDSLETALKCGDDEIYIIGGESLYKETLPLADILELTLVHASPLGDTYFPSFQKEAYEIIRKEFHEGDPSFTFYTLQKK